MSDQISRRALGTLALGAGATMLSFQARAAEASVADRVRKVIADHLMVDASQLTPATRFDEDLGADSLDLVEILSDAEDEFGIEVPDDDAAKLRTVGDAIGYFETHVRK